jgi:hypothetical protein
MAFPVGLTASRRDIKTTQHEHEKERFRFRFRFRRRADSAHLYSIS